MVIKVFNNKIFVSLQTYQVKLSVMILNGVYQSIERETEVF